MAKVVGDNIIQGPWGVRIHPSPTFKPPLNSHEREILLDQLAVTLAFGRTGNDTLPLKVSFLVTSLGMDHGRILFAIARLLQANVIDRDMIDFECVVPLSDTGGGQC